MKLLLLAITTCFLSSAALADDSSKSSATDSHAANTVCPVSGDKVGGDMGKPVYVQYQGKTIALCCKDCVKQFKKDPAKYAAKAEAQAAK
jgi:YHS domain-containing protein